MKVNQEEIQHLYESVDDVWPQDDHWHLYSKKQHWEENIYVLNAGSGGNDYGLKVIMHHRDLAENKICHFDDYSVGSIEQLPQAIHISFLHLWQLPP